jgi:hypothetical protein
MYIVLGSRGEIEHAYCVCCCLLLCNIESATSPLWVLVN